MARACDTCGGPLRADSKYGVCYRNPECLAEQMRRRRVAFAEDARRRTRAWRLADPERAWSADLRKWFGIDATRYRAMHDAQGGVCAICHRPETAVNRKSGKVIRLAVDHDHVPGFEDMPAEEKAKHVRGLLCSACNPCLRDHLTPEMLRAMADYLERYKSPLLRVVG